VFHPGREADTTFLALQVSPTPDQTRSKMLKLSQLNLHFAFMALCALRKNVENQAGAIDYSHFR
jgi:hypothetical protein